MLVRTNVRLRPLLAPGPVTHENLQNLANIDADITLPLEQWRDLRGYRYEYFEGDIFFLQMQESEHFPADLIVN